MVFQFLERGSSSNNRVCDVYAAASVGNKVLNCIAINRGDAIAASSIGFNGKATAINCVSYAPPAVSSYVAYKSGFLDTGSTNNTSSDSSANVGSGNITNVTEDQLSFVDYSNEDFHIEDDSVLINAGTDQSSIFTTDVDLQTFSYWNMGIDFNNYFPVGSTQIYTTIGAAFTAIPSNLTGEGIKRVVIDGEVFTETLTLTKSNPDSSNYVSIATATGDEHHGIPGSGVVITGGITVDTSYTQVRDIEINGTGNLFNINSNIDYVKFIRCYAKSTSGSSFGFRAGGTNTGCQWICCIGWTTSASWANFSTNLPNDTIAYNCVSIGGTLGFRRLTVYNCVEMGATTKYNSCSGDYNASDGTAAPGSNSIQNLTDVQANFIDKVNGDFHIGTDSILIDAGTNESGTFTKDIDEQTIQIWMIGADYPITTTEETQCYIIGGLYNSDAYPDDPTDLYNDINSKLGEVSGLSYTQLSINRSENRFSGGSTREQLLVFLKDVTYNNDTYLNDSNSSTLRTNIISKLDEMTNFTYTDVEIRSLSSSASS